MASALTTAPTPERTSPAGSRRCRSGWARTRPRRPATQGPTISTATWLFGTAAPDDTDTGGLDAAGPDEEGDVDLDDAFGTFGADDPGDDLGDHDGLGHGLADDVDDVDDLAEIEGLGPVDDGPDELDIGSF